jgi:hypothetical protein
MLRSVLVAAVVVAAIPTAPAADPLTGNWLLSTITSAGESAVCILTVETRDGKPAATVAFSPPNIDVSVGKFEVTDTAVLVTVRQARVFQGQRVTSEVAFVGVRGKDPKVILGSTGSDMARTRARLAATNKTTLEANELILRTPLPGPIMAAQQLMNRPLFLQNQAAREQDENKKKELLKQAADARREVDEKVPALYREVIEKHADSPAALDAVASLLRAGDRANLSVDEVGRLVALVEQQATRYGEPFLRVQIVPALTAYKAALEKAGKVAEAKSVDARLAKFEGQIDAEYLAKVPPFKPVPFAGRKDRSANRVAVMELFTGAQCPPCVAADAAFDALVKAYKPTDLVLIQYHMHIPGPDPMTNPDTAARWDYYRKLFPEGIRGVPSSLFNGKPEAGGGGGMAQAEGKYKQYVGLIDPLLEKTTSVKVGGKATRSGDTINIAVEVDGADGADLKLRLLVVEETVRFPGGNGIRFHHQVVRAMPGGPDGVALKDKAMRHSATADVATIRAGLEKYLTDFASIRPFPQPGRPLDMKHLRVIALVQNDKTGEILQGAQLEVEGTGTGTGTGGSR